MIVGGRELPAGSFTMLLLEEGYKDDTLLHITPFILNGEKVLDDLNADCIDSDAFVKTGADIQIMLNALHNLSPYKWFDIDGEMENVVNLFTAETAAQIEKYFCEKSKIAAYSRAEAYIRNTFRLASSPEELPGRALYDRVKECVSFYMTLADDLAKADYSIRRFMRELPRLEKADEHNLLTLALNSFKIPDFDIHTEYISIEDKKGKNTLARRSYFRGYYSFFMTDFFEGIRCGHYPRRCQVCGRYFMMESARRQKYCDGYAPKELTGGKKISCRKWAASKKSGLAKERAAADPVKARYNSRCGVIREYKSRGTITPKFAEQAARIAREHRDRALKDTEYANTGYAVDMELENILSETQEVLRSAL